MLLPFPPPPPLATTALRRGNASSSLSAHRAPYLPTRARAEDKHREAGRRRVEGKGNRWIGILCCTQKEFLVLLSNLKSSLFHSALHACHAMVYSVSCSLGAFKYSYDSFRATIVGTQSKHHQQHSSRLGFRRLRRLRRCGLFLCGGRLGLCGGRAGFLLNEIVAISTMTQIEFTTFSDSNLGHFDLFGSSRGLFCWGGLGRLGGLGGS